MIGYVHIRLDNYIDLIKLSNRTLEECVHVDTLPVKCPGIKNFLSFIMEAYF